MSSSWFLDSNIISGFTSIKDFIKHLSTLTTVVLAVGLIPTISTSSLELTTPLSISSSSNSPLPAIEKTSSTAIKNGLSVSLTGAGIYSSRALINSKNWLNCLVVSGRCSTALRAELLITGTSSPWYSYFLSNSLDCLLLNQPSQDRQPYQLYW